MIECGRTGLVHGGASGRFDGFQIETAPLAEFCEGDLEEPIYFAGDFLVDGVRRFFS